MNETKTPFTDVNGVTPFSVYLDAENAIQPIDEVIKVLCHAYGDFGLGNKELDADERRYLLTDYDALGSMIMLAIDSLEKVRADFYAVRPKKEEAQTQSNPESDN